MTRSLKLAALALGAIALGVPSPAMAQSSAGAGASAQVGFEKRPQLSMQDGSPRQTS